MAIARTLLRTGTVVAAVVMLVAGGSAAAAPPVAAAEPGPRASSTHLFASYEDAVPGVAPLGADATAVYLDLSGQVIPTTDATDVTTEAAPLAGCTPVSGRDNPHRSGNDVSGHGWWQKGSCSKNLANVRNCLYEWYTDNTWRRKACSSLRELRPYTGSGDRTTARRACDDSLVTSWRNHVDVDVIGENDTSEWPHNQANVSCRVYGADQ